MTVTTRPVSAKRIPILPPVRRWGPGTVVALCVAYTLLWLLIGPEGGGGWVSFLGQLAGAQAVLLMSVAIVLISVLPVVEAWFDGIDRAAIWHRRLSIAGMLLLIPHVMFATGHHAPGPGHGSGGGSGGPGSGPPSGGDAWGGLLADIAVWGLVALVVWAVLPRWRDLLPLPRRWLTSVATAARNLPAARRVAAAGRWILGGYERWRALHRLTGLFLAAGFVHGLLDATMFGSPVLRWTYVAVGGVGMAFYAYARPSPGSSSRCTTTRSTLSPPSPPESSN